MSRGKIFMVPHEAMLYAYKKGEFVAQKTGEIVIIRKQRVPSMFVRDLRKSQRIQPRNVLKERLKT